MRSSKVSGNYDMIEELVIVEIFLNNVDPEVKTFLADKCVSTFAEAAIYVDDYFLIRN